MKNSQLFNIFKKSEFNNLNNSSLFKINLKNFPKNPFSFFLSFDNKKIIEKKNHINIKSNYFNHYIRLINKDNNKISLLKFSTANFSENKKTEEINKKPENIPVKKESFFKRIKSQLKKYGLKGILLYSFLYVLGLLLVFLMVESKIIDSK